jgi:DNA-directed RNA polymerase subunit RPC12/RpoP
MANEIYGSTSSVNSLPGSKKACSNGEKCDDHPEVDAVHRIQGETDSFGCEYFYVCQLCFEEFEKAGDPEYDCDGCGIDGPVKPARDPDEGMAGPVYYYCTTCMKEHKERISRDHND